MRVISLKDIKSAVSFPSAIDAVKQSFIDYADGLIEQPHPMQILFTEDDGCFFGDCHAKAAQHKKHPYFVIKVAAGFYKNSEKGLPPNSGLVLVMSAETGRPVAVLQDDGWLTQVRTAAAGALAASLKPVGPDACLGLIGAGTQAFLQAKLISEMLGLKRVVVCGRNFDESAAFCKRLVDELDLEAVPMKSAREVCHASKILVTATPSSVPVVTSEDLPEELHIVAVGADSPGKSEIDPSVVARADIIATDNHDQCVHHGDFGTAVRAGVVAEDADVSFCHLLAGKASKVDFGSAKITLIDLTGVGAQDLAVASLVVEKLNGA